MARDKFHQEVRIALENEGWLITDDPLFLKIGRFPLQIDLGAEKIIGAEKDGEKIAVEIKTFGNVSFVSAFYEAVGQYITYRAALVEAKSVRTLYLAIPHDVFQEFGSETLVQRVFAENNIKYILYEPSIQKLTSWTK